MFLQIIVHRIFRRYRLIGGFAVVALLTACGGGGGGGGSTPATQLAPQPLTPGPVDALEITAFAPASGAPGSTITVNGLSLAAVTSAKVGGADASFRANSDTVLEVTVPAAARTGRIELGAAGRTVLSPSDFTVVLIPTVTAIAPTTVVPPGRITLTGTGLDLVREVRLNALTLTIATRTATSLGVDVPTGAASGTLTVVDTAGVARALSQTITIAGAVTVSTFAPATIVTGQTLTVNGANLDRAVSIVFANGTAAPVASHAGTTRLTAIVPDAATSGVFRVRGDANDEALSASALQVIPAIRVNANLVYRVAAAGDNVTMTGTGLTEVSGVRVAATTATVVSRSATQLVFAAPGNLACGAITLDSASQPSVAGGSLVVGAGCVATVAGIEFAQVLSQGPSDARLRLVTSKETWVRAFVVAMQANVPAPLVRLTGYNGAAVLGTVDMAGPPQLPVVSGANVPDSIRYSEAQSFNVELPAAWVRSGLSVRVEVDPLQQLGTPVVVDATPALGSATRVEIVLVPLISGGFVPAVPTVANVLDEVTRRFPIPRANISVTTRAAYTLTSVVDGLDTQTEWSNALVELNQLRSMEVGSNTTRFYFGLVRRSGGSIAGIGYVSGRSAIGWDAAGQWPRTMSHELGHNLSRLHAPCGAVANPDPDYPYAGGVLSATPLMDSVPVAIDIISPVNQTDIMGYCGGSWFSDYNYREMQRYMENQPGLITAQIAADAVEDDLLLVSGTIGADGLVLAPVQALRGVPSAGAGEYTLRLVTRDGQVIEHAFQAQLVDHADPPERQFAVTVPSPGALSRVEVLRSGSRIGPSASGLASAQRATGANVDRLRSIDWREESGILRVQWDASAAPHLSATYVVDGTRTVLGMHRAGGAAEFDVSGLPADGRFEFALSDGLNVRILTAVR